MAIALSTEELSFRRDGDTVRGYGAWPAGGDHLPGLVLIPDVRGLSDHYRDVARRFAEVGFFTFAIDLYSREGAPDLPDMQAVLRWLRELPDPRVLADLGGAVRLLAQRPEVRAERIGITGFCMGGQYALMAACAVDGLAACVSWYGMLRYEEKTTAKPASPLELAANLGCPYLGLFGAEDAIIPLADVEELRATLAGGRQPYEIHVYPGAGHAFFNDTRPDMYRPAAAADGWQRAVGFLRQHLPDPSRRSTWAKP
jgi:carboxymethylenebutenolidase